MQKKDTPTRRKGSSQKRDPLAPYRQQADHVIAMMYDDEATPDFIIDLLEEWLSELESTTQVFWNRREIAVVAFPLMFQAAAESGIDYMARGNEEITTAMHNLRSRREAENPSPAALAVNQIDQERREVEADADAIARIVNSPRVPESIKEVLHARVLEITDDVDSAPEVLRVQWPLALRHAAEREKEAQA